MSTETQDCPKVSVLIPNFNYARYLGEAIQSVLAQSFRNFELLVSDNQSTDDSAAVIQQFASRDKRIRYVAQDRNIGAHGNYQWCLGEARGEYIRFLNADDMMSGKHSLGTMVQMLDRHPDAVLASSAVWVMNDLTKERKLRDRFGRSGVFLGTDVARCCLTPSVRNLVGEPSAVIFRRKNAQAGFGGAFNHWADLEVWLRILEHGCFAYTTEGLSVFRVHGAQATQRDHKQFSHILEMPRFISSFSNRAWLNEEDVREAMLTIIYRSRKSGIRSSEVRQIQDQILSTYGRWSYAGYYLRRKLLTPFGGMRPQKSLQPLKPL